jgi:hypothetical protein
LAIPGCVSARTGVTNAFSGDGSSGGEDVTNEGAILREEYSVGWSRGAESNFKLLAVECILTEIGRASGSTDNISSSSVTDPASEMTESGGLMGDVGPVTL